MRSAWRQKQSEPICHPVSSPDMNIWFAKQGFCWSFGSGRIIYHLFFLREFVFYCSESKDRVTSSSALIRYPNRIFINQQFVQQDSFRFSAGTESQPLVWRYYFLLFTFTGERSYTTLMCPMRVLCCYVEHTVPFTKSNRLSACNSGRAYGALCFYSSSLTGFVMQALNVIT